MTTVESNMDQLVQDVIKIVQKYIPADMDTGKIMDRSSLAVMLLGRSRTTAYGALMTSVAVAAGTGLNKSDFLKLAEEVYTRFETDPVCQHSAKLYQEGLVQEKVAKETGLPIVQQGSAKVH